MPTWTRCAPSEDCAKLLEPKFEWDAFRLAELIKDLLRFTIESRANEFNACQIFRRLLNSATSCK